MSEKSSSSTKAKSKSKAKSKKKGTRPKASDKRTGTSAELLGKAFHDQLEYTQCKDLDHATPHDLFNAAALTVRDPPTACRGSSRSGGAQISSSGLKSTSAMGIP